MGGCFLCLVGQVGHGGETAGLHEDATMITRTCSHDTHASPRASHVAAHHAPNAMPKTDVGKPMT